MTDRLVTFAVVLLVLCAAALTGMTLRRELFPRPTTPERTLEDWQQYTRSGSRIGPSDAAVTIVAWSDYECAFCRRLEEEVYVLRTRYPGAVAVIWRHFPLPGHALALPAARAATCAGRQGRFQAFHELIFYGEEPLGIVEWSHLAARAGVPDTTAFVECTRSRDSESVVERDIRDGQEAGVIATPTLIVNGKLYSGMPRDLDRIVKRELVRRRANRRQEVS